MSVISTSYITCLDTQRRLAGKICNLVGTQMSDIILYSEVQKLVVAFCCSCCCLDALRQSSSVSGDHYELLLD